MSQKTTRVKCNSQVQLEARPYTLSDVALIEMDSDVAPAFTLTPEAQKTLLAETIMEALAAFDFRPTLLAEDFQEAKDASKAFSDMTIDHEAFTAAQDAFDKACRGLFFTLDTMINSSSRVKA